MRKLLLIVLMMLSPFQATWAMASAYCEHSGGTHDQHFGHHEGHHHEADAEGDETDKAAAGPSTYNDGDASHCHGVVLAVLSADALIPVHVGTLSHAFSVRVDWRPPPIAPPERPQWASHA